MDPVHVVGSAPPVVLPLPLHETRTAPHLAAVWQIASAERVAATPGERPEMSTRLPSSLPPQLDISTTAASTNDLIGFNASTPGLAIQEWGLGDRGGTVVRRSAATRRTSGNQPPDGQIRSLQPRADSIIPCRRATPRHRCSTAPRSRAVVEKRGERGASYPCRDRRRSRGSCTA